MAIAESREGLRLPAKSASPMVRAQAPGDPAAVQSFEPFHYAVLSIS